MREDVFDLMRFWLDKGVDGFRMDVIPLISKQPGLPDLTPEQLKDASRLWANGPHRDEYLQEMNREVLSKYDVMTVGEAIGITLQEEPRIVDERPPRTQHDFQLRRGPHQPRGALHRAEMDTARTSRRSTQITRAISVRHDWDTVFLSNHDNPRLVSNFGDDSAPESRIHSAKLLETMLLTLRGTPFLYQGDELGMTNYPFTISISSTISR